MTLLRPVLIGLLTLFYSASYAAPPAARGFSADIYLSGCKDFVAGSMNFFAGRCAGIVDVLNALNSDTKVFCAPEGANTLQLVRAIVTYLETRPERMSEDFRLLANEALAKTWPCPK